MSNAVATQTAKPTKLDHFLSAVITDDRRRQIENSLPRHINFDRFERNLMNAVMANPDLMTADPSLLWREISKSVQLGILLDPELGEGYLIMAWNGKTRRKEPQYRSGWRGLVKLARQSGEVLNIYPREVHEKDHIVADLANNTLEHKPDLFGDRGPVVGYYAVVKYKNGEMDFEPMSRQQVEHIRDEKSDGYKAFKDEKIKSTPWASDFDEMAKKTTVRRLCKRIPKSPELQNALSYEDAIDYGGAPMRDITPQTERPKLGDFTKPAVTHQPEPGPADVATSETETETESAEPFFFTDAFGEKQDEPLDEADFYQTLTEALDQCQVGAAMEHLLGHNQEGIDRLTEDGKTLLLEAIEQNNQRLRALAIDHEKEASKQAQAEKDAAKVAEEAEGTAATESENAADLSSEPAAAPAESENPEPAADATGIVIPLEFGSTGAPREKAYFGAINKAFKDSPSRAAIEAIWRANRADIEKCSKYWQTAIQKAASERVEALEKAQG